MSVEVWKIEKNLCRCCHAEGDFDNLAEPRVYLEQEEIYYNMLRECFNIEITPVPGELCAITYAICKACILRLRDASSFKKQVQHCEERFMELYCNKAVKVLNSEPYIKQEDSESGTDYNEDFMALNDENHEGYDIKQDEENPDSDKERNLTLKKAKTKIKAKSLKSKNTTKIREEVKKRKSPVKEKKGDINERLFTVSTATDGTKDFSCNICQHVFKKRQNFQQHYKHVHLKQRPKLRSCHLCDVKVPGHMRAFHMEEHGLPAPSCGACGKKFSYPFQVLQHQKYYHMGERKFACEYCDLKFRSRYALTKHTIKHTGVRSFKCEFCDKSFKWKNNLRIHLMMHLNDKRHVCPVCDEAFVQTSSLKYHIMKRHPDLV